jgi:murein DD-endopeptidase MepM/ murein hydrolase activator NlpD
MMHKRNLKRIGKLLLWASISLGCVALAETGQEMVRAIGLDLISPQPALVQPAPAQVNPAPPTLNLDQARQPAPALTAPSLTERQPKPASGAANRASAQAALQASRETDVQPARPADSGAKLAINAGAADQQVVQISQAQVATGTWQGASFPVENFQAYTSPFGYRSSPYGGYTQEFHYGLDMAAPEGSYIRTWWSGKVVEVSDDSNCGTSVVIESGPWMHIYCHMQGHVESEDGKRYMIDRDGGVQIWENQQIQAGSRLGRVGMTGRTTGPHLHWGLKYDKNWVDPALVLRAMYVNQQQTAANPNREQVR